MTKMIHLVDDIESTIKRILSDDELEGLGLNKTKVRRTLASFQGDEIATSVFLKKYALRDADGQVVETALEEAKDRWAAAVAGCEDHWAAHTQRTSTCFRELYEYFLPAGRQMFALGNLFMKNVTFTNCLSGSTFVSTDKGLRRMDALSKAKVRLNGKSHVAKIWRTGTKLVKRVDTVEGYFALPTGDHRFQLVDGSWRETDKLQPGDRIVLGHDSRPFGPLDEREELRGYATGLFVGDGTFAGENFRVANVRLFGKKSRCLVEKVASLYGGDPIPHVTHVSYNSTAWARDMLESADIQHGNKTITDRLMSQSWSFLRGFLRGLFDADGCVIDSKKTHQRQIVLVQSDRDMLCRTQILLLAFGIRSVIYKHGNRRGKFPRGVFRCRQGWSLHISRHSFETFAATIGFAHPHKAAKMRAALNRAPFKPDNWYARVKSVTSFQRVDVYDMSVPGIHAFSANGLVAHNCYVTKIEDDSIEGIYGAAQRLARTYSYGGGIGLCIGELRPRGAKVSNSARQSTGSVSFMELFSMTTGLIGQAHRRGALMITIPVSHPDAEEFIEIKHGNTDKVKHANISIKLTDAFMRAVAEDGTFEQVYSTSHETIRREIHARKLWEKIIQSARDSAEPGLMFWDRMVEMSPSECYPRLRVHSTNPCGEQVLEPGGACVLGSLLLHQFVVDPFTPEARFDHAMFREMVGRAVRHLDNVVEMNLGRHGLAEQEEAARLGRRIGLGITGLADMLAALGIRYDSPQAIQIVDDVMRTKRQSEYLASIDLAKERGAFPLFDPEKHYERGFCALLENDIKELGKTHGQRNVAISTVAPAGSLSVIAQCSSGIEPIFALHYKRYVELGTKRKEFSVRHQGLSRLAAATGSEEIPWHWVTAHNIDYRFRISLQGVIQKHTDASISSTINLPRDIEPEVVGEIYLAAWKAGLKGVTVYREGSREGILVTDEFAKQAGVPMDTIIYKARAEAGDMFYIPVSYENGDVRRPYQVFLINYKTSENDRFVKIGNDLVRMLREKGVDGKRIQKYIDRSTTQLSKVTRFLSLSMKTGYFAEAVAILGEHGTVGTLAAELYKILHRSLAVKNAICRNPGCGSSNVRMEEGCMHCLDCGWSGCG